MSKRMSGIKSICDYIIGFFSRFGLKVKKRYCVEDVYNSVMCALEDSLFFKDRSGYIVVCGVDGAEYVSGNDYSLAISYDGSRPNINYRTLPVPNIEQSHRETLRLLNMGGGYLTYKWIDPNQAYREIVMQRSYVKKFSEYMYVNCTYTMGKLPKENTELPLVMADFISQLISKYLMYNIKIQDRRYLFLNSIDDGNLTVVIDDDTVIGTYDLSKHKKAKLIIEENGGGFLDRYTFCTKVAYFDIILWYTIPA